MTCARRGGIAGAGCAVDYAVVNVPQLSAIVLCYRAEEDALAVVGPLRELLERSDVEYEMVLVANYDEGDRDSTPDVVRRFAANKPTVRFVAEPKQDRAMGWDMRCGLEAARGDCLVVIDGDTQNPVADVVRAYEKMARTGVDVLKGRRVKRGDGPYRRLTSLVYNLLFMVMFGTYSLWDINGKPKGIRREAVRGMGLRSDGWFIDAEIVLAAKRAGMRISELPVHFNANEKRASFVKPWAIVEFLVNMVRYRFRRR